MDYFTYEERLKLKQMLGEGRRRNITKIAATLNRNRQTIYNELALGDVNGIYDPDVAQNNRERNIRHRGDYIKAYTSIITDNLAEKISSYIIKEGKNVPETVIALRKEGIEVGSSTVYRAISKGLIPGVSKELLDQQRIDHRIRTDGHIYIPRHIRKQLGILGKETGVVIEVLSDTELRITLERGLET